MKHLYVNLLVATFALVCFSLNSCVGQENVALGAPYVLSDKPNHKGTTRAEIEGILTDGTSGSFNKGVLGWKDKDELEINLDLKKNQSLSRVEVSLLVNDKSRIYLPQNVFVFTSLDKKSYTYIGDLLGNVSGKKESNGVESLTLSDIGVNARYIKFVFIPNRNYLLLGEIRAFKNVGPIKNVAKRSVLASNLKPFLANLLDEKRELFRSPNTSKSSVIKINNKQLEGVEIKEVDYNSMPLAKDLLLNSSSSISSKRTVGIAGSYCYKLLAVVNNNSDKLEVYNDIPRQNMFDAQLYKGIAVSNTKYKGVIDALMPIENLEKIELSPGEEAYFLLKLRFKKEGVYNENITFFTPNGQFKLKLPVNAKILPKSGIMNLNAINWSYLDLPQIKNIKKAAVSDLKRHDINVYPVARNIISKITYDKRSFISYFDGIDKSAKVLLYFAFNKEDAKKIADSKSKYLSEQWKKSFQAYLKVIYSTLNDLGYKNIYIYPYDEVSKSQFEEFKSLTNWLRKDLKYKCYVTVLHENMLEAGNFVDIAQYNTLVMKDDRSFKNISAGEKWLYEIFWYSRDVSPLEYRLLAWKAYYNEFTGIGFWNYSKTTLDQNFTNSTYFNGRQDHSVIYNAENGLLLSSFRWESFYLGMQDYLKLKYLEKVKGKNYVKRIVSKLLYSVGDIEKTQILTSLDKEFMD